METSGSSDGVDFGVLGRDALVLRCTSVGSGPAVVLLHAGGEDRSVWRPVARRLARDGFRSIAVDQRGHGETGGPKGTCLDEYAADVSDLLVWLDVPVTLVGASLGGLASLLAVTDLDTRARARGLVLVDVRPDPDPVPTRRFLRGLESGHPVSTPVSQRNRPAASQRSGSFGPVLTPAREAERGADAGREPDAVRDRSPRPSVRPLGRRPRWEWALIEDILSRPQELRRAAASLDVPVTLVRGGASPVFPARDVARFRMLVPEAAVHVVPGAGHLVARDRPDELATAILGHLRREAAVGPP
jgi:pimeloyl-ACP methyl ester carboxylesterase